MNIKYNQLCIRNAEKKDCEQLAVWWNDGTVMAHAGFPNGLGTSAAEIEKQIADDSDETRRRLIIEYNDVRIGEMSFYVFENHRYEIGIKICESDYQEKGIGRVVMDCGFAEAEFFVDMLCSCVFEVGIKKNNVGSHAEQFFYEHAQYNSSNAFFQSVGFEKTAEEWYESKL